MASPGAYNAAGVGVEADVRCPSSLVTAAAPECCRYVDEHVGHMQLLGGLHVCSRGQEGPCTRHGRRCKLVMRNPLLYVVLREELGEHVGHMQRLGGCLFVVEGKREHG
jgi:hypothetical protein